MTLVHAVHYSSDPAWWQRVAPVLGFSPTTEPDVWAAGGLLTVRDAEAAGRTDGSTDIEVLVADPAATLAAAGQVATLAGSRVQATAGPEITVGSAVERNLLRTDTVAPAGSSAVETLPLTTATAVAVMPIWYSPDAGEPVTIITALGLRARLASDSGGWQDFTADGGGQLAWHHAPSVGVELSMEHSGDLDALARTLTQAGVGAAVVDEAYNRTLLVDAPHGAKLWVNGTQEDLYGYTRAEG